jgi:hypothetical protein
VPGGSQTAADLAGIVIWGITHSFANRARVIAVWVAKRPDRDLQTILEQHLRLHDLGVEPAHREGVEVRVRVAMAAYLDTTSVDAVPQLAPGEQPRERAGVCAEPGGRPADEHRWDIQSRSGADCFKRRESGVEEVAVSVIERQGDNSSGGIRRRERERLGQPHQLIAVAAEQPELISQQLRRDS